ncbi:hypothetical protein GobsT_12770 [Gemmata obscuriglobus]|uniref:Uncharacterized protein n=1 Tax=Gemmata obscuriglobus TaxID=114 RepID=A0A2Z3HET6_9BACT|nr:hypothetical protein [Gemmata obscuriglobus]AWM40264.1 hypothetical protein C1280_26850 [Gemmata obscuriglobus]QEG26537.1 hypothetical protein GobsT_12770 [Gemmata obscuriglobus]VTS01898.1 unnamed protein product [Gemmata obscuriglobus UQM 2246]
MVFQHNYPYQIWEDFAGPGADEFRVRVWSAEPVRAAGLCVDGGAWTGRYTAVPVVRPLVTSTAFC